LLKNFDELFSLFNMFFKKKVNIFMHSINDMKKSGDDVSRHILF